MLFYPVTVPGDGYRGNNFRRKLKRDAFNLLAGRIQVYLNDDLEKLPDHMIRVYISSSVAADLGADPTLVRDIIFGMDAGSGGVTICKGDFEKATAR